MKKGFTLIELLAVIVILAIIALIATPIIMGIINDSKKESLKRSVDLYIDGLLKKIASLNMTSEFNPSTCMVTNGDLSCDGQSIDYQVDGRKPTSGTITLNNGKVTEYTLVFDGYTVTKSGNSVTVTDGETVQSTYTAYTMGQLLQYDPVNNAACTSGDTCYKWRVITVGDTTSTPTITLQMDHNIIDTTPWVIPEDYQGTPSYVYKNDKGPITALKTLEDLTESWDDSLKLNYTYDTTQSEYNYGVLSCVNGECTVAGNTVTTNLKARMITADEITAISRDAGVPAAFNWEPSSWIGDWYSFEIPWLVENTISYENVYGGNNYGYWTLSPMSYDDYSVWIVNYEGTLFFYDYDYLADSNTYGIRPVITIPKTVLQ